MRKLVTVPMSQKFPENSPVAPGYGPKTADHSTIHSLTRVGMGISLYRPSDGPLSSTDYWFALCSSCISSSLQPCQGLSDLHTACPLTGFRHYPYASHHATRSLCLPLPSSLCPSFGFAKSTAEQFLGEKTLSTCVCCRPKIRTKPR